jgi:hypothetical protein
MTFWCRGPANRQHGASAAGRKVHSWFGDAGPRASTVHRFRGAFRSKLKPLDCTDLRPRRAAATVNLQTPRARAFRAFSQRKGLVGGKRLLVALNKTLTKCCDENAHRQSSDFEGDQGGLVLPCHVPEGSLPDPVRNLRHFWVCKNEIANWASSSSFKIAKNTCLP